MGASLYYLENISKPLFIEQQEAFENQNEDIPKLYVWACDVVKGVNSFIALHWLNMTLLEKNSWTWGEHGVCLLSK